MKEIIINTDPDEKDIPKPETPIPLDHYPNVEPKKAWELANLTRIAYRDYECFDNWFEKLTIEEQKFTLEKNRKIRDVNSQYSFIYTSNKIEESVIDKYFLSEKSQQELNQGELNTLDKEFKDGYFQYKILKTYEYLAYYPFGKIFAKTAEQNNQRVDLNRFGFIAERQEKQKKTVFVVFRGTRELAEWFSNAQFQQIDFLKTNNQEGIEDCGKISLGFNEIYTEFRPTILITLNPINQLLNNFDTQVQEILKKIDDFGIKKKSVYNAIKEFLTSDNLESNESIYITGHSLGAALATVATMHIAQETLNNSIFLYTFASPRVGNNTFAKAFNKLIKQERIKAFRFANTEDIVPNIPFSVWLKADLDLPDNLVLKLIRSAFNKITGEIFNQDYQHVGEPIYFTHQAIRTEIVENEQKKEPTATVGDNHNMTKTYCGALENQKKN